MHLLQKMLLLPPPLSLSSESVGLLGKDAAALKFLWPEVLSPTSSPVTLGIGSPHQHLRISINELKIAGGGAAGQSEVMSAQSLPAWGMGEARGQWL